MTPATSLATRGTRSGYVAKMVAAGAQTRPRLVVIGGEAAGMSAASQARRLKGADALEIVAFEAGLDTSYSACGIPYWIGDLVATREELVVRTPESFRDKPADRRANRHACRRHRPGSSRRCGSPIWTAEGNTPSATTISSSPPVRPRSCPRLRASRVRTSTSCTPCSTASSFGLRWRAGESATPSWSAPATSASRRPSRSSAGASP